MHQSAGEKGNRWNFMLYRNDGTVITKQSGFASEKEARDAGCAYADRMHVSRYGVYVERCSHCFC